MKCYKGFDKNLQCRGFQYEVGKAYETDKAELCECGFHACENPLDVFRYYSPNKSVYHEVELSGDIDDKKDTDSKVCATNIKVGVNFSIADLVKAAIDFTMSKVKNEAQEDTYKGASSATGTCGASSATGTCGASSATGTCGASSATGYKGASSANNPTAVAVGWGHNAKAKGCIGAHLVLADWEYVGDRLEDGEPAQPCAEKNWILNGALMSVVDGEKIKADTWYKCVDGQFVECEEDEE